MSHLLPEMDNFSNLVRAMRQGGMLLESFFAGQRGLFDRSRILRVEARNSKFWGSWRRELAVKKRKNMFWRNYLLQSVICAKESFKRRQRREVRWERHQLVVLYDKGL